MQPVKIVYCLCNMIKLKIMLAGLTVMSMPAFCQSIDSIAFHLYTDSLKKGTHNYINIDGRTTSGKWLPLSSKEIEFTATEGKFEGNDLVLPFNEKAESIIITAILKQDRSLKKEITIWIKKKEDDEILPTNEEYIKKPRKKKKD